MSDVALNDVLGKGWKKPPFVKRAWLRWMLMIGFVAYLIAAFATIEVDWGRVYVGLDRGWQFVLSFTRPDFVSRWSDIWNGLLESIVMTVAASVVGIAISIPIGLGAARNIAPLPVYIICRGIVAISRAASGNHRCDPARRDLRLWAAGRVPDLVVRHNRVPVKAFGGRH